MAGIQWKKIARSSDLKEGIPHVVEVDDEEILLLKKNGEIHACGNKCTHYGGPLNEGHWNGHEVTCPWHFARFDIRNGTRIAPPALDDVQVFQLKVEEGDIFLGRKESSGIPKPKGKDPRTVLILGAGAAGNAATETLRREGFAGRIQMVTQEDDFPYDRPNLSKGFMAGKAKIDWIPLRSPQFYADHNIDVLRGQRITNLDVKEKAALTAEGKPLYFDLCLMATGGKPRKLDVPGADLKNIFTLRSFRNAKNIVAAIENGAERILIVGAGFIGMEVASSFRKRNLEVHIAAPEEVPMEHVLGKRIGKRLHRLHEKKEVVFHLGTQVEAFKGEEHVREVMLSDGSSIPVDMVIIGIGIDPAVDYLKNTKLIKNGVVPVDERLQTPVDGVFAAGDIALFPEVDGERKTRIEHWAVAESQGQFAARAMLGHSGSYKEIPFFWTMQYKVQLKYMGYPGKTDRIEYLGNVDKENFLAGFFEEDEMRAAATIGMGEELFNIQKQMKSKSSISPLEFINKDF